VSLVVLVSGLAAGAAHVVTGPDHLAAIAPLAVDSPARGLRIGAAWGLGHGVGVLLAASVAQLLRTVVSLDELAAWSERLVGVVLIGIGLWALRKSAQVVVHSHGHGHPDTRRGGDRDLLLHDHPHLHLLGTNEAPAMALVGQLTRVAGERHLRLVLMSVSCVAIGIGIWWLLASSHHATTA